MIAYLDASALAGLVLHDRSAEAIGAWIHHHDAEPSVSNFGLGKPHPRLLSASGEAR